VYFFSDNVFVIASEHSFLVELGCVCTITFLSDVSEISLYLFSSLLILFLNSKNSIVVRSRYSIEKIVNVLKSAKSLKLISIANLIMIIITQMDGNPKKVKSDK
jgi:hypothetical protein